MNDRQKLERAISKIVGSRIRTRRIALGLSSQALGASLGITYQRMQKLEAGEAPITKTMLGILADELSEPVAYFVDGIG